MLFSREKKQDGQNVVVKDAIYMHAVRLQQMRREYCSDCYPSAICTLKIILLNGHVTNHKVSGEVLHQLHSTSLTACGHHGLYNPTYKDKP